MPFAAAHKQNLPKLHTVTDTFAVAGYFVGIYDVQMGLSTLCRNILMGDLLFLLNTHIYPILSYPLLRKLLLSC